MDKLGFEVKEIGFGSHTRRITRPLSHESLEEIFNNKLVMTLIVIVPFIDLLYIKGIDPRPRHR